MAASEAIQVLIDHRKEGQLVITNQGSSRLWPRLSTHPLDFHYLPSAMGGAIPLALGLALAQPDREVVVCSGDGALLMNLGCLVSVVDARPKNLTIITLENGIYEVTGGQQLAAAGKIEFASVARSCGFSTVASFAAVSDWVQNAPFCLSAEGPRFIVLHVQPVAPHDIRPLPIESMEQQVARLQANLA